MGRPKRPHQRTSVKGVTFKAGRAVDIPLLHMQIGVDSGTIAIMDAGLALEEPNSDLELIKDVGGPGTYKVNYTLPNTWNGKLTGSTTLKLHTGVLFVGDPGYVLHGTPWDQLCEQMNRRNHKSGMYKLFNGHDVYLEMRMGGDGGYHFIGKARRID